MRRKPNTLLPIELAILRAAIELRLEGEPEFHGYRIARAIRDGEGGRRLTAHGTLYKALERLQRSGLLRSRWEAPEAAEEAGRPRRRLYTVTPEGARALERARASDGDAPERATQGWQPA